MHEIVHILFFNDVWLLFVLVFVFQRNFLVYEILTLFPKFFTSLWRIFFCMQTHYIVKSS